jgi:AraC family transcriptional regulator
MTDTLGTGHFFSWEGGFLVIGAAVAITPMHSHYAIQVAFGSEPGIRFRPSDREPWTEYDGVVISSRQPHTMNASTVPYDAVLFVEPETREGRALTERFSASGITALPGELISDVGSALFDTWRNVRTAAAVEAAAKAVITRLTDGVEPSVVSDERILRATAYIRSHLGTSLTLDDVADVACLSPSRFRHLFVEQTGMALRPYVLWRRFLRVWELLMEGESLSTAAHSAGFADAAHLTRTSRRMFGFPPSALEIEGPLRRTNEGAAPVRGQSAQYPTPPTERPANRR